MHEHGIQATFFVTASEAVRHPELMERMSQEGHAVGNHTFTHASLTPDNAESELVRADRVIKATAGVRTSLFRMPYNGHSKGTDHVGEKGINAMLAAQRLGYVTSLDDFDTNDWRYGDRGHRPETPMALPSANRDNITMLLHDGGGDRGHTVDYLMRLIPWARAHGYEFQSLPQVSQEVADTTTSGPPGIWDRGLYLAYRVVWTWPESLLHLLFLMVIVSVVLAGVVNVALALARRVRYRHRFGDPPEDGAGPTVSILIAALNEEAVIAQTLTALAHARHADVVEIIVVDDGSTDGTAAVVEGLATREPRLRVLRQGRSGKAAALNRGFRDARGEVVVTLDADTVFTPDTVGNLVRHFRVDTDGRLGVVSGIVKVGNVRNLLTRWQALEYVMQLGVDRGAQDVVRGIMVVPGACAAWRRDAVAHVGGFSHATLTEDCDMALTLRAHGYRAAQDDDAVSFTEAPETVGALARQRFRWMYGNIQALWKHRSMIFDHRAGWLGLVTLPSAVISVLLPIVFMPFVYLMAAITIRGEGISLILLYAAMVVAVQMVSAVAGVWLMRERPVHLLIVPLYRLIYEPLRAYLLYRTLYSALRGRRHGWSKLQRTGRVTLPAEADRVEVAT